MSGTVEYTAWADMKSRCYNEKNRKYPDYGGRGISVCAEWRSSFVQFYSDMGARPSNRHSIDRIDNDGSYEPSNCHWATMKEQANNRRARCGGGMRRKRLIDPSGIRHVVKGDFIGFCIENNLNRRMMSRVLTGHNNHHRMWTGCKIA
jgi:hypothetical protein